MQKTKTAKPAQASPDKLAKVGRKVGVELTEGQLGQVIGAGKKVKIDF